MSIATRDPLSFGGCQRTSIECRDVFAIPSRITDPDLMNPQIGWSDSTSGERWLALGEAESLSAPAGEGFTSALSRITRARGRLRSLIENGEATPLLRFFGGIAFDPRDRREMDGPGRWASRFILPRVAMRQIGERADVISIGFPEVRLRRALEARAPHPDDGRRRRFSIVDNGDARSADRKAEWTRGVQTVLRAIEEGRIRKVVLSRDIDLKADGPIDPWKLMRVIHERSAYRFRFCFRFDRSVAFLGATPERLLLQSGRSISCDCLAGTIARGETPEEDAMQARRLRESDKDRLEHHLVLEGIREAVSPLIRWCEAPSSPEIMRLPRILHLSSPVRGWLRDGIDLAELVGRLHPTAAVAGAPREAAMDLIREVEGRARGWYAGAVGWVGAEEMDLAVAIRSAVVRGERLTVHGGAGIVSGSLPELEWEETARKAASLTSLFAEGIS